MATPCCCNSIPIELSSETAFLGLKSRGLHIDRLLSTRKYSKVWNSGSLLYCFSSLTGINRKDTIRLKQNNSTFSSSSAALEEDLKHFEVMPSRKGSRSSQEQNGHNVRLGISKKGQPTLKPKTTSDVKESVEHETSLGHLSDTRFDSFKLSPLSIRALHELMHYEKMTFVQEATLPMILQGRDVLAKAKTGTGKTIAFLLPAIETILQSKKPIRNVNPIHVLVVCPARELAMQATTEAATLLKFHNGMGSQTVIGGTNMSTEARNLRNEPCQVLIATPGRLLDHIGNTPGLVNQLKELKILVLDEADTLLGMGFRKNLLDIIKVLPRERQTLLFSATVPDEVHGIAKIALKEDHDFVDTVGNDDDTHAKVKQQSLIVSQGKQLEALFSLLNAHIKEEPNYKVLVFCITANITAFMAETFHILGFNTREIHSRKTQSYRTRVSDEFRKSRGGLIMFTSDVSARGIDYPDVTLVIQIGSPSNREQYIHRVGRTGRAGKEGQGVLLLLPCESAFLKAIKDIPIERIDAPETFSKNDSLIKRALSNVAVSTRSKAYQSWLGYYTSTSVLTMGKGEVVRLAEEFSASMGLQHPPSLLPATVKKMGLKGYL